MFPSLVRYGRSLATDLRIVSGVLNDVGRMGSLFSGVWFSVVVVVVVDIDDDGDDNDDVLVDFVAVGVAGIVVNDDGRSCVVRNREDGIDDDDDDVVVVVVAVAAGLLDESFRSGKTSCGLAWNLLPPPPTEVASWRYTC
jgi:hypothetical protein